jgi:hypothetical protein
MLPYVVQRLDVKMISGELLQSIAEISLYDEMTDLIRNQNQSMPQKLVKISDLEPNKIKEYKIIYVYTHFLESFFNKFFDHLNNDTVLISHNSDLGIHSNYLKYLEGNKIKKWYCQNREISHPKLFSIPIGLANSQWPHGNQQLIKDIREKNNKKDILIYKNFDINTNSNERNLCNNITNNNGILLSPSQTIAEYWNILSKSVFVISPPGNGIDCHRIWEALYLKCVPIIKEHEAFSQFKHLPILFVNCWKEVTIEFLKSKISMYLNNEKLFDIPLLEINYWKEKISE